MNDERTRREVGLDAPPSPSGSMPVAEGTILADKYRVERVLGRGGMGVVVAAMHLELDQRVALKFLLPEAMYIPEVVERFAREARAAVKIQSEHVARVIDVGKLDTGLPYMVMEYLHGRDLSDTLDEEKKLSVEDTLEYVLQACEAIAHAHALGIVHRDLKPANLFLTTRPDGTKSVKVLDFGISKVSLNGAAPAEMSLTRTAAMMGSPTYMSPEQMKNSRDVDARADIWALGVILFELLSGQPPWVGGTMPELCAMILTEAPPRLRELREDVPEGVERAVARCLEKNAASRFANVAELAAALVDFAPKRARISAERCARILKGAGIHSTSLPPVHSNPPKPEPAPVVGSTAGAWSQAATKPERPEASGMSRAAKAAIAGGLALASLAAFVVLRSPSNAVTVTGALAPPPAASAPIVPASDPSPPDPSRAQPPAAVPAPAGSVEPAPAGAAPNVAAPAVSPPTASVAPKAKPRTPIAPAPPAPKAPEPPPSTPKRNPLQIDIK